MNTACELCAGPGGTIVWQDALCRVVQVDEPGYPGFCRVVLARHAREMSDLAPPEREALMRVVFAVEAAVREAMAPDKMNLASLGNAVAHVHWHVIPRFADDAHFPGPIWAAPRREAPVPPQRLAQAARVPAAILARLVA